MENFPQIPGYRIVKKIGEGATALVFLGISEDSNRRVAIKCLKAARQEEEEYYYRFLREARIVKKLNHPNIIKIFEVGQLVEQLNEYYIIMECLEDNLSVKLKNGIGLTEKETIRIFRKIAGALQYAHSRGVIHRDIKPANILFRRDGTPVLTDFGLARMVDSQTKFTRTGAIMGTAAYMSPEQCKGAKADYQSDIYNLGVVLFEMLTGRLPYRAGSNRELWDKHVNSPIPSLPPELKNYQPLIKCMMAKDKKRRINSARQATFILEQLSSKGRKREPKDTSEILKFRGNFLQIHKNWLLPLMLIVTTIALLVVILMIIIKITTPPSINKIQSQKKPPINKKINSRSGQDVNTIDNNHKMEVLGGKIIFEPKGNTYIESIQIQLIYENLQSSRGSEIPSEIYYTIDGSEPTKNNSKRYIPGEKIVFSKPGEYWIKAKLYSKMGKYEGLIYTQQYLIIKKEPKIMTVSNLKKLDQKTQKNIFENTKKILIEVDGIEKVRIIGEIRMHVLISNTGKVKVLKIIGIEVIPKSKSSEVKASLAKAMQQKKFIRPTINGNFINVDLWIDFKRVDQLGDLISLSRL